MEGADTGAVVMVAEDTGEDLAEAGFMAEVLEDIPLDSLVDAAWVVIMVVDGTEEAVTGEDAAITRTEDTPITVIPTILTDIGQLSVILMAGASGSGFHIIEGKGSSENKWAIWLVFLSARFVAKRSCTSSTFGLSAPRRSAKNPSPSDSFISFRALIGGWPQGR